MKELSSENQTAPLMLMTKPPADPLVRDDIGKQIWAGIVLRFESTLSTREKNMWINPPANPSDFPEHMRLLHLFDDFLLTEFSHWGWRLMLSSDVVQRLAEWEKHDPRLCERLGRELALKSSIFRGEKSAPLPLGIEEFADGAISELSRLLRMQRDEFAQRPTNARCERIAEWIKLQIEVRAPEFPDLYVHRHLLHAFVESLPRRNQKAARNLERGDVRPESFFYMWYAASTNRSIKDVRNQISLRRTGR